MTMRIAFSICEVLFLAFSGFAQQRTLGTLSVNPYDPRSTGNPYGTYGSPYAPQSIKNPQGVYGSPYSPHSVSNPYATDTPRIYSRDGRYLGKLSANPYDPESTSNPYGIYGSRFSPTSIKNPFSTYGSPYSPVSPNNPYSMDGPVIVAPSRVLGFDLGFDDPE
jgi:hypothetical protein